MSKKPGNPVIGQQENGTIKEKRKAHPLRPPNSACDYSEGMKRFSTWGQAVPPARHGQAALLGIV